MRNISREAFWGYEAGERRNISEMPPGTYGIIFQEIKTGEAVMQYELPLDGKQDAQVWKPGKEHEQQIQDEARLDEVRQELKAERHL